MEDYLESKSDEEQERENDDWCWVCWDGVAEDEEPMVCCSTCPRIYHRRCHIPQITKPMSRIPVSFYCLMCKYEDVIGRLEIDIGKFQRPERLLCSKVVLRCFEDHQESLAFLHPPNGANADAAYFKLIKRPMSLSCVAKRLNIKPEEPFKSVAEFIECMDLIFKNASTYNQEQSEIFAAARKLWNTYDRAVKEYLPCYQTVRWEFTTLYNQNKMDRLSGDQSTSPKKSRSTSPRKNRTTTPKKNRSTSTKKKQTMTPKKKHTTASRKSSSASPKKKAVELRKSRRS